MSEMKIFLKRERRNVKIQLKFDAKAWIRIRIDINFPIRKMMRGGVADDPLVRRHRAMGHLRLLGGPHRQHPLPHGGTLRLPSHPQVLLFRCHNSRITDPETDRKVAGSNSNCHLYRQRYGFFHK
jgi:hypothetical protein